MEAAKLDQVKHEVIRYCFDLRWVLTKSIYQTDQSSPIKEPSASSTADRAELKQKEQQIEEVFHCTSLTTDL